MREDELQHFDNPLKGIMREGHKYLERLGEPGHYTYIYDTAKKAVEDVTKRVNDTGKEAEKSAKQTTNIVMDAVEKTAIKLCTDGKNYINSIKQTPINLIGESHKHWHGRKDWLGPIDYDRKLGPKRDPQASDVDKFIEHQRIDLKEVNDNGNVSFMDRRPGRTKNCAYCTLAWELRRRGYDVQAKQAMHGGVTEQEIVQWYQDPETLETPRFKTASISYDTERSRMSTFSFDAMYSLLTSQPNGSRGQLCGYYFGGGGHSMGYEIVDGKLMIIEGQSGKVYYGSSINDFKGCSVLYMKRVKYLRTDNKQISKVRAFEYVENAKNGTYHTKHDSKEESQIEDTRNRVASFLSKYTSLSIFGMMFDSPICREEIYKGYNKLLRKLQ